MDIDATHAGTSHHTGMEVVFWSEIGILFELFLGTSAMFFMIKTAWAIRI